MDAVIGVDLGGTKILSRVVDSTTGAAVGRCKIPTPDGGPKAVLKAVADTIVGLEDWGQAAAIGIGVPGMVVDGSTVLRCPNIAGWDEPIDVASALSDALGKPVAVGNDVDCGALAEYRQGAGIGADNMMAVFVGTGVGGGLVRDGRLVTGPRGLVGEIGHVTVKPGGRACGCGGQGHLEAYAGRAGIERRARTLAARGRRNQLADLAGTGPVRSRHLARALDEGDDEAHRMIAEAADALALVIGNLATFLDLERVILGGGVVDKLGQSFVDQVGGSPSFGGLGPHVCELRLAERIDDAGVLGAAMLAVERFG